ncbi:hypothetical protein DB273_07215, partial [Neisseria gonorrhoeae]|nr:hypothetical protein BWZ30_08780 [Neisseria meningitidis]
MKVRHVCRKGREKIEEGNLMPSEKSKKQDTERILLFCKRKMLILQLRQQELRQQELQRQVLR